MSEEENHPRSEEDDNSMSEEDDHSMSEEDDHSMPEEDDHSMSTTLTEGCSEGGSNESSSSIPTACGEAVRERSQAS